MLYFSLAAYRGDIFPVDNRERPATVVMILTKEELLKQIQQLLTEAFELEAGAVTPEAHLYRDLDLDSFDAIDLAVSMESKTGIKLQEEELKSIRTVSDIVEIVYPKYNL
jgi:acyl carrier protein